MSVYLSGSSVLLNAGLVATDEACCCGGATGACCYTDGSCVIHTSNGCTGSGGTYQGDGTVCDPNPCPPPCCSGAFVGFLGVGHYLVKTDRTVRTAHVDPTAFTDGCDVSTDITTTTTLTNVGGICSSTVTCSGSSYSYIVRYPTIFSDCSWVSDGAGGCHFHLNSGTLSCNIFCIEDVLCDDCSPATLSDTEQYCSSTDPTLPPGESCNVERTITLSSPCNP